MEGVNLDSDVKCITTNTVIVVASLHNSAVRFPILGLHLVPLTDEIDFLKGLQKAVFDLLGKDETKNHLKQNQEVMDNLRPLGLRHRKSVDFKEVTLFIGISFIFQ